MKLSVTQKMALVFIVLGFIIGTIGQIIWAIIFWSNDYMFPYHINIAIFGILVNFLAIPCAAYDVFKSIFTKLQ